MVVLQVTRYLIPAYKAQKRVIKKTLFSTLTAVFCYAVYYL